MDRLRTLLDKLAETLRALDDVLAQEQQLLCADELPGVALQRVTDSKSQLLATVAWLEQQRPALEANLALRAPYQGHESFSERWRQIQSLREKNQHNGLLLNQQIAHNQQALAILSKNNKSLYGPDGQSRAASLLGRKIGV